MEVFLTGLPPDLTDRSLQSQLTPYLETVNIRDWSCQKPRKKPFGNITFLRADDGQRFLQRYERPSFPGAKRYATGLVIFGSRVTCKLSNRLPDTFLLRSLTKSAAEREEADQTLQQPSDRVTFHAQSLSCGYYTYASGKLVYSPEVYWQTKQGVAKFARAMLVLEFDDTDGRSRIEIPYRIVEALTVSAQPPSLTLTLWEAPRFFHSATPGVEELLATLSLKQIASTDRSRVTQLPHGSSNHHEVLGQALVYRISVSHLEFEDRTRQLHKRGALTIYHHNVPLRPHRPLHQRKSLKEGLAEFKISLVHCSKRIPFTVLFQMEALVRNGYLLPWTVESLVRKMAELSKGANGHLYPKSFPISAGAVKRLFAQIPFPGFDVGESTFGVDEIWQYIEKNEAALRYSSREDLISEKGRQNLTMIHKVNVTPTGITLHGPDPEAKNRILRRFPDHSDYFIRVQFCDEDGTDLQFNAKVSNEEIYQRFKSVFKNGIAIGGRVYGFLGFSHSSLRSHSAWFMASFFYQEKLQTYFSVISHLGKFQNIYSPARCAARIGQAFSETPQAVPLAARGIRDCVVPDVKSGDGSRVFSDGVGTISRLAMEAIHADIPQRKNAPTCFQVRWGGAKGMLALDPRLEGSVTCFRPSMIKFESEDTANLEICDMGNKPIPMVLNRQMIKILEDMGVSDDWFFQQQDRALSSLQLVTAHISNTISFLTRHHIATEVGLPQFIRRLDSMGIDYRNDRFIASVVEAAVLRELRLLKHKARIPVERGVTLFGIMDETGYLNAGEVYVAFDNAVFIENHWMDLDNRRMIVTRSPALHPGDIQLAINIIPPSHHPLRALRNCIVFSQRGQRDLPSCLSGGDLDGDTYNIIWDPDAVSGCQRLFQPADYPRVEPLSIGREVEREDITDFFIQFMATNKLGLIAVRHMILADQRYAGTADSDCLTLAELHSTGVDYAKTGVPVDMRKFGAIRLSKYRPDFLAPAPVANIKNRTEIEIEGPSAPLANDDDDDDSLGPVHQYYYSEKINGKLYRAIDEQKIWYQTIHSSKRLSIDIWDVLFKHVTMECDRMVRGKHWAEFEEEAWEIRSAYEDAIQDTTLEYSDHAIMRISELEVFTGSIFNKLGVQTRRQRDKSIQLKDEFDRIAKWTAAMIRDRKTEISGEHTLNVQPMMHSDDSLILSIACLHVGMTDNETGTRAGPRGIEELQSFKVIAACCVIKELDLAKGYREEVGARAAAHATPGLNLLTAQDRYLR